MDRSHSPVRDEDIAARQPSHERSKRFRFKDRKASSSTDQETSRQRRRHHQSVHHRSKRRKIAAPTADDASAYDDSTSNLPPDSAFRESLFDALADDEGAAFWEGVYGQPIHSYSNAYQDEETGELERMDDEEYTQYVRRRMWEKSWEGIEAAKEEKRREREKEKKQTREDEKPKPKSAGETDKGFVFDFEVEQSLRRGERRKEKKRWRALWEDYIQHWNDLQDLVRNRKEEAERPEQLALRNKIAWPVESGRRKDVSPEGVERFITTGTKYFNELEPQAELLHALKFERVRWHPDKVQQRFGFMEIDEGTMKGVTAVFQAFDGMWNSLRGQK